MTGTVGRPPWVAPGEEGCEACLSPDGGPGFKPQWRAPSLSDGTHGAVPSSSRGESQAPVPPDLSSPSRMEGMGPGGPGTSWVLGISDLTTGPAWRSCALEPRSEATWVRMHNQKLAGKVGNIRQ